MKSLLTDMGVFSNLVGIVLAAHLACGATTPYVSNAGNGAQGAGVSANQKIPDLGHTNPNLVSSAGRCHTMQITCLRYANVCRLLPLKSSSYARTTV